MEERLNAYFNNRFSIVSYGFKRKPIIERLIVPNRKYTNKELLVICALILLHTYREPERTEDVETYETVYEFNRKSLCEIEKNYEFSHYKIRLEIDEEDLSNPELLKIASTIKSYIKASQINKDFKDNPHDCYIDKKRFNHQKDLLSNEAVLVSNACPMSEIKRLIFYLFNV